MEEMIYIVKISIAYRDANFEFKSIDAACKFMKLAVAHQVNGEHTIEILMTKRKSEIEDEKCKEVVNGYETN